MAKKVFDKSIETEIENLISEIDNSVSTESKQVVDTTSKKEVKKASVKLKKENSESSSQEDVKNNDKAVEKKNDKEIVAEQTQVITSFTAKSGGNVVADNSAIESISITEFKTTPAKVLVDLSRTINTGNYNSLKISIGISLPCYVEMIDEGYKVALDFVTEKLDNELVKIANRFNIDPSTLTFSLLADDSNGSDIEDDLGVL